VTVQFPSFERRRRRELLAELIERAGVALPEVQPAQASQDWLRGLFDIVARTEEQVTRRLERVPEKQLRNFFDWLGERGRAARAARIVAVFRRRAAGTPSDASPLLVPPRARLQASTDAGSVVFETEQDLAIVAGGIQALLAVDGDKIFQPPPGLFDPAVRPPAAIPRQLKSFAAQGSAQVQVDPPLGLTAGNIIAIGAQQYRVQDVAGDLVSIDPTLGADAQAQAPVEQVTYFAPFGSAAASQGAAPHDWQEHVLYIGDDDLLNIEAPATITIDNVAPLAGAQWQYWGKADSSGGATDAAQWQPLGPPSGAGGLVLSKPKGAIEKFAVNGQQMRVLRATCAAAGAQQLSAIKLRIASGPQAGQAGGGQGQASDPAQGIAFEGIANTAPIPSPIDFYPLGREPRLFDSFYLGCAEAFSKKDAAVTLMFTLPTPTLGPLAQASADAAGKVALYGVGRDGVLYRLDVALGPNTLTWGDPVPSPAEKAVTGTTRTVSLTRDVAPALVDSGGQPVVAVVGQDNTVWVWHGLAKVWHGLGQATDGGAAASAAGAGGVAANAVTAVVLGVESGEPMVFALRQGKLFKHRALDDSASWSVVDANAPADIASIKAVKSIDTAAINAPSDLIAANASGDFFLYRQPQWTKLDGATQPQLDPTVAPLAIRHNNGDLLIVAVTRAGANRQLVAIRHDLLAASIYPSAAFAGPVEPVLSHVPRTDDDLPVIVFLAGTADTPRKLGLWQPKQWSAPIFLAAPWADRQLCTGAAVLTASQDSIAPDLMVIPGGSADVLLVQMTPSRIDRQPAQLSDCAVLDVVEQNAQLVLIRDGNQVSDFYNLTDVVDLQGGKGAYRLATSFQGRRAASDCRLFRLLDRTQYVGTKAGSATDKRKMKLAANDTTAHTQGKTIKIGDDRTYNITSNPSATRIVTVDADLPGAGPYTYQYIEELDQANAPFAASIQPILDLSGVPAEALDWLKHTSSIDAPGAVPPRQHLTLYQADRWALLDDLWISGPPPQQGALVFLVPPTSLGAGGSGATRWIDYQVPANPALSWEYWNGTGWWKLDLSRDETDFLRKDGDVAFSVPPDLQPTDVIGRTNHWVRARLVGGDYGHESYTLQTSGTPPNTTQTVTRNTDSIRAPRVLGLTISYSIDTARFPAHVITRDNLAWRDQSDANRSSDAIVEVCQSFQESITKVAAKPPAATADDRCCEDDIGDQDAQASVPCGCGGSGAATSAAADCECGNGAAPANGGTTGAGAGGGTPRALFLGSDVPLENASIRIFWEVDEQSQDAALQVDVLNKGSFQKVLVKDDTGGLTEPGLLTLAFDQPPSLSELFGQSLYWLRLSSGSASWMPVIRGIFLNAAWAQAAETQDMEILGSSDGSPGQTVSVARTPVLEGSLELRVSEPLTEDQVEELRKTDASVVVDGVANAPGYWVRWTAVTDPADGAAGDRVYALDEASGEIRFGDGLHGAIPPRGRDNIAALVYRKGGGAAANAIPAASPLQLVSPLPGVEAVVAANDSAGGADPATPAESLRHAPARLWGRDRVVTARDVEGLALASSPDIVQARCVTARSGAGLTRVIIVMRDRPQPTRSQRRALQQYLVERAEPALGDVRRFLVGAPNIKPCRIELALTIDTLDRAGSVEQAARDAIAGLLHWVTGGLDGSGWPLGAVPAEDDLAAVLVDIDGVRGIGKITVLSDDAQTAFPAQIASDTLVMPAADGISITLAAEAFA
jgi:hypothetical protein